jgi:hypothetical protein
MSIEDFYAFLEDLIATINDLDTARFTLQLHLSAVGSHNVFFRQFSLKIHIELLCHARCDAHFE